MRVRAVAARGVDMRAVARERGRGARWVRGATSVREVLDARARVVEAQTRAVDALERTREAVTSARGERGRDGVGARRGAYLHGTVGRGKTMLMDALYESLRFDDARERTTRTHFHAFMSQTHAELFRASVGSRDAGTPSRDPLVDVGKRLRATTDLLLLDEIEISDVGDAMVFKRLMESYLDEGGALVATSNFAPDELYRGGVNRSSFVSFIDTLGEHCEVIDLFTPENVDYRRLESSSGSADATETVIVGADADARERLERSWARLASSSSTSEDDEELVVGNNRAIRAKKRRGDAVWFTFHDLCGQASRTHPTDFIELARRFKVICVQDVPRLPISTAENEARRFINLIDVLYEHRTVLLTNLHASPDALFDEDRSSAAEDRDLPLRERTRIENDRRSELHVTSTGGSSGRSTTMLAPELEWSATGRVGASLADVSSVNFVAAASPRARSRLHHMSTPAYHDHTRSLTLDSSTTS